jgi:hypothetical protein
VNESDVLLSAFHAEERGPDKPCASFRAHHPRTVLPRRIVSNVLTVTAFEIRDPVAFGVLVKAHDPAWNCGRPARVGQSV